MGPDAESGVGSWAGSGSGVGALICEVRNRLTISVKTGPGVFSSSATLIAASSEFPGQIRRSRSIPGSEMRRESCVVA